MSATPLRAYDDIIDSPMYKAPDLPVPLVVVVYEAPKDLWLKALGRPEADLQCRAADTIALAHRRGVKGLETTVAPLVAALDRENPHPAVQLSVALALIALDAREAAPSLFHRAQAGTSDLRSLIEPALARWDYQPARAAWLERLRDPATPPRNLVLAIQGLSAVREGQAADRLRELALSAQSPAPVRLEAARALGLLRTEGLEEDAERLAADTSAGGITARLAAAALLRRHGGDKAVRLLQRLVRDPEPAVAAPAVSRLLEIDPGLVASVLDHLLASPDANVRSFGVEFLRQRPTVERLRLLADRLDDPHPDVRVKARKALHDLAAKKEFREPIITEATRVLAKNQWRGLEQAAILLTQLGHKPAADRFLELLVFPRAEVALAAGRGLRGLAVPETLPGVLSHVEAELKRLLAFPARPFGKHAPFEIVDYQLSQLNQFLGQQKYAPADAVLRQFIPKRDDKPVGPESRAAAIWALGLIHEGKAVGALVTALEGRLTDRSFFPPEHGLVRRMSAVSLGRMKAKGALAALRSNAGSEWTQNDINNACLWAIERLTGETVPPPKPIQQVRRGWFLTRFE